MSCSSCGGSKSVNHVRPTKMISAAKGPGHFTSNIGAKKVVGRTPGFPIKGPKHYSPTKRGF